MLPLPVNRIIVANWKIQNSDEAQDITQDTFIRFLGAAQTYSDIKRPKALLYTIANKPGAIRDR